MNQTSMIGALALALSMNASAGEYIDLEGPRSPVATAEDLVEPVFGQELEYELVDYRGARQLGMSREFVHLARAGLGMLYRREYRKTRAYFAEMETVFPGTAVSSIADVLVWQSAMLENFDFRHDTQYRAASESAKIKLEAALKEEGNEGWENFMLAGVVGVEAIHSARQGRYLPALTMAFKAIDYVEKVRVVAPDFVDLKLADGLYNYWRTVITQRSKALPDFGDHKQEGIEQIQLVEREGIFLAPPATLSMAFTWIEERQYKQAVNACGRNRKLFPQNVVNELMLGMSSLYLRQYDDSLASFERVLGIDPKNQRVRYYKGLALYRAGRVDDAYVEFETYLAFDYLEDYQRAATHYRLGQVFYKQKKYVEAEQQYKAAVKVDGYASAKAALDRMKKARKEGKITY